MSLAISLTLSDISRRFSGESSVKFRGFTTNVKYRLICEYFEIIVRIKTLLDR